jgi:hypothetical protein
MFENNSRYLNIQTATLELSDGRKVSYVRRRFLPAPESIPTLAEVIVNEGDRLDVITYRTLGDPEQFWRICDSNAVMDPDELTSSPGSRIRIGFPQPGLGSS